jgi:hypothetical protein
MQEEANSLCIKEGTMLEQNVIYTLKLLPKHMKQITKCHAFQVNVVVENVETLHVGWCVHTCVRACVCVVPSLRCGFVSRSVQEVWSCLCMTNMKHSPWDAND